MKFLFKVVLIAVVAHFISGMLPWWYIAVAAFVFGFLLPNRNFLDFLSGFLAIGGLWFVKAYLIDMGTDSILTEKISGLLSLNNSFLLIVATALIGGFVGGFSSLTGALFRSLFRRTRVDDNIYRGKL